MNRQKLIEMHLIFGSFLIPVVTMFAITGALYSFKITGNYETKKSEIEIPQAVSPDLDQLVIIARKFISENSLAEPSGNPSIKKMGQVWQLEWTGSRLDFLLEPTDNPLKLSVSIKQTTWHRFFVQLHKAKGGYAFKLLAAVAAFGLILLLVSGWFMAQFNPKYKKIRLIAFLSGLLVFVLAAVVS